MRSFAEAASDVVWGVLLAFLVTLVLCALLGCSDASACWPEPYPPHEDDPMTLWLSYEPHYGWELWTHRPVYDPLLECFDIEEAGAEIQLGTSTLSDGHTIARMLQLHPTSYNTPQLFRVKVTQTKKIKPAK